MSDTTTPPVQGNLRKGYLSIAEVMAQSIGVVAPSTSPAFTFGFVFASAGNALWLAYLVTTVILGLVAYNLNQFTRRSSSPGSLYTFVSKGLGPTPGVICGWAMVIAYLFTGAAVSGSFANYGKVLLQPIWQGSYGMGFDLAMIGGVVLVSWFISFQDVQLSTRAMLLIEFVSMALTLVLVALFIGKTDRWIDPAQFKLEGFTTTGLRLGLVLAVFSFSGFEGAATMGGEAKNPLRSIPRAISGTLMCIGTYFIITAYILVAALRGHSPGLDTAEAPLSDFANMLNVPVLGYIIAIGINISNFACVLACLNGASRILFAMSRNGLLPATLGDAHPKHATPHRALAICAVISVIAPVGLILGGVGVAKVFEYLGTMATYGFLFSYVLVSVASPIYLKRRGECRTRNVVMSVAAVALLAVPIVGNLYPPPEGPMRVLPYIFISLLATGAGWFFYVKSQRPHVLKTLEDQEILVDLA